MTLVSTLEVLQHSMLWKIKHLQPCVADYRPVLFYFILFFCRALLRIGMMFSLTFSVKSPRSPTSHLWHFSPATSTDKYPSPANSPPFPSLTCIPSLKCISQCSNQMQPLFWYFDIRSYRRSEHNSHQERFLLPCCFQCMTRLRVLQAEQIFPS